MQSTPQVNVSENKDTPPVQFDSAQIDPTDPNRQKLPSNPFKG